MSDGYDVRWALEVLQPHADRWNSTPDWREHGLFHDGAIKVSSGGTGTAAVVT